MIPAFYILIITLLIIDKLTTLNKNKMELQGIQNILNDIQAKPLGTKAVFSAEEAEGGFKIRVLMPDLNYASKGYWVPKSIGWNDLILQTWKILNDAVGILMKETFIVEGVDIWNYKKPSPRELVDMKKVK